MLIEDSKVNKGVRVVILPKTIKRGSANEASIKNKDMEKKPRSSIYSIKKAIIGAQKQGFWELRVEENSEGGMI